MQLVFSFFKKKYKKSLTKRIIRYYNKNVLGVMAQLVERLVRNEEASGSNPLSSTKTKTRLWGVFFVLWLTVSRTAELSAVRASNVRNERINKRAKTYRRCDALATGENIA